MELDKNQILSIENYKKHKNLIFLQEKQRSENIELSKRTNEQEETISDLKNLITARENVIEELRQINLSLSKDNSYFLSDKKLLESKLKTLMQEQQS